jgi:hypothetical protein
MRDRETIDSELRPTALVRQSIREPGDQPSCRQADESLDERGSMVTSSPVRCDCSKTRTASLSTLA